jgi:hypothetical protein
MAIKGVFRYFASAPEALDIIKDFAKEHVPEVDLATADREQRAAVFQTALDAGVVSVEKEVPLRSLREHPLSIRQGGAQLCYAPSRVDLQSPAFLEPIDAEADYRTESHLAYYEEMEKIARALLGPQVVHTWCLSHILRRSEGTSAVGETAGPLRSVHNDFTEEYGSVLRQLYTTSPSVRGRNLRKMLMQRKGLEFTSQEMANYQLVVLNTWRPITAGPLRRDPLAVVDNRSIQKADLQRRRTEIGKKSDDPEDDFALEVYLSRYNPGHRWHYVEDFTSQDLLVFKTYDSEMDPFIPTLHSAFDLPAQEGAPPRESCEARVICLLAKDSMQAASRL